MIRRAFAVRVPFLVLAILNGGVRETLLAPRRAARARSRDV